MSQSHRLKYYLLDFGKSEMLTELQCVTKNIFSLLTVCYNHYLKIKKCRLDLNASSPPLTVFLFFL